MHPDTFERELQTRLGPHYRLRWSAERHLWCVEHKVARKTDHPGDSDRAIRLRDGYHLVLEFQAHDTFVCPECHFPTYLTPFDKAEVTCDYCTMRGSKERYIRAYFPLCDRTIEWLEWCHPRRGVEFDKELAAQNTALRASRTRWRHNKAEDAALDGWQRVVGIPQFGYTKAGTPHLYGAD